MLTQERLPTTECLQNRSTILSTSSTIIPRKMPFSFLGRIPGYKTTSIQLLPSSTTKQKVWEIYQNEASTAHLRNVSQTYFMNIWKTFTPEIVICKPRSDLCFICHQNSSAIIKAANKPESEKAQVL